MPFRSIVREFKEMRDGIGSMSRKGEGRAGHSRGVWGHHHHHHQQEEQPLQQQQQQQQQQQGGDWANLPPELLLDIIGRVEASETSWPARKQVVACASVCRSWREVVKEIVRTPEQSGRITFPISLKQPGPSASPIQCFIRRERGTHTYRLYLGLSPAEANDKLLLSARKVRRATTTGFVVTLSSDDFSRSSSMYIGKLRSNFLGTKFTVYDSQPPCDTAAVLPSNRCCRRFHSKQVSPRVPAGNYQIATIVYELNVLRTRGPRRMQCTMHCIPLSSIREGGTAPTPTAFVHSLDEQFSRSVGKGKEPVENMSSTSMSESLAPVKTRGEPLVLKNKTPRWHEQLQCWCLNFRGRVTVASVKNFQLVAAVDPFDQITSAQQEKVILQFGKIGKDIFTMDYCYPLSAFQAFTICLTSFDTKPACE